MKCNARLHPKICHTFPKMIEFGNYTLTKEDPKNM